MRKFPFFAVFFCVFGVNDLMAQSVAQKLQKAYKQFETDEQLKHALSSLYVIDAATGKVVFDKNSQTGLAPASTQKIITSVTAFELLGKDYRYKTSFYYDESNSISSRNMVLIRGHGDPTFGSWRYKQTTPAAIFQQINDALRKVNIDPSRAKIFITDTSFELQKIPDGWIWQDIGNYYGTGLAAFNWKENQADIELSSGKQIGDPVEVNNYDSLFPYYYEHYFKNTLRSAARGTGDNAYYYFGYGNGSKLFPLLKGTIPINEKKFKISIAVANPAEMFIQDYNKYNKASASDFKDSDLNIVPAFSKLESFSVPFYTYYSPSLDSIIYWFNKKRIKLYGEALIKAIAFEKTRIGSTDTGVAILRKFWKEKGLDEDELNMYDGSGLSPLNRVTTHAQVEILKYAKSKDWFPYFYDALPEYNAIKMKSGTINDVKGFCGYHIAKDGKEYIFSFLVNNYSGRASDLVNKMYVVLNNLK